MQKYKDLPPSEKALKLAEEKKEKTLHKQKSLELLREDFGKTFNTDHGMRVLAWLKDRSDFGKVILSATPEKGIDPMLTTYKAMELNQYLAIREYIPIEVLQKVEYGLVKPSGNIEKIRGE